MKDLDLSQVFCEVVSGLAGMLILFGCLDVFNVQNVKSKLNWFAGDMSGTQATGLFVLAYLLGLIVDAFGLWFDRLIDRWIGINEPTDESLKAFYKGASRHVFGYWKEQWVYFSCYRNLLMCLVPGGLLWAYIAYKYWCWGGALFALAFILLLGRVLWLSLKDLKRIYCTIPTRFVGP